MCIVAGCILEIYQKDINRISKESALFLQSSLVRGNSFTHTHDLLVYPD